MFYNLNNKEIEYIIKPSKKRKTVSVFIKNNIVEIRCPEKKEKKIEKKAESILQECEKWILKHIDKSEKQVEHFYQDGDKFYYDGNPYILKVIKSNTKDIYFYEGFLIVKTRSNSKENVKKIIRDFYCKQTLILTTSLVRQRCCKSPVFVKNYNRYWGLCKKMEELYFSSRLACAPFYLIEAVVCHEIAHLTVSDHSKRFYNILNAMYPDYKKDVKKLSELSNKYNFKL